jgi:translation initiation factor IF-2
VVRKNDIVKLNLKVSSLKQNKVSLQIVREEEECGVIFEDFNDFQSGDYIDCYDVNSQYEGITNTKGIVESY